MPAMPSKQELPPLQVLLIETKEGWIAQGVEHDISVEAEFVTDLLYDFERAMVGHYFASVQRGVEPFTHMPPAPPECVELWASGHPAIIATESFRMIAEPDLAPPPRPEYRILKLPTRSGLHHSATSTPAH